METFYAQAVHHKKDWASDKLSDNLHLAMMQFFVLDLLIMCKCLKGAIFIPMTMVDRMPWIDL